MDDVEQVRSYVKAYEWGGPTSALQLHHIRELSRMIRPGDTVLDLACGPGPLLLELAPLFPQTTFIGADLSSTMLEYLREEIAARGLANVMVLQEDIRTLPSVGTGTVDLVISTSALHHLPDDDSLVQTFRRMKQLLKPGGGCYLFDFGLLKSAKTRGLFVAEVAKLAPPLTAHDYSESLKAAFPIDWIFDVAGRELGGPLKLSRSLWVDIMYFLQTPFRTLPDSTAEAYVKRRWSGLNWTMRVEHLMMRALRTTGRVE
jgi:SAM-dependent methyltransferase